jgi:hypothetical protein
MRPIFIGGTGRSGTTVLKRILSRHSKIVSLRDELRVIVDPDGALELILALSDQWSPYDADLAIHHFLEMMLACGRSRTSFSVYLEKVEKNLFRKIGFAPRRYLGMGLGHSFGYTFYHRRLAQLINDLSYATTRGSWGGSPFQLRGRIFETEPGPRPAVEKIMSGFFDDLYAHISQNGETHWLEDTPYNILHANELLDLFPAMRLVHIFRDPRDVLASYLHFAWGGGNCDAAARRLAGIYQRWVEIRASLPTDCFIEISLEQLSNDPRNGLKKICDFVGIEFEENLMQVPLDKVHAGRWQRDIPIQEQKLVGSLLDRFVELYGYLPRDLNG